MSELWEEMVEVQVMEAVSQILYCGRIKIETNKTKFYSLKT